MEARADRGRRRLVRYKRSDKNDLQQVSKIAFSLG